MKKMTMLMKTTKQLVQPLEEMIKTNEDNEDNDNK